MPASLVPLRVAVCDGDHVRAGYVMDVTGAGGRGAYDATAALHPGGADPTATEAGLSKRRRSPTTRATAPADQASPSRVTTGQPTATKTTRSTTRRPARSTRSGGLRRWALPGFLAAAGLAAAGILYLGASDAPATSGGTETRPVLGQAAAPVVIREYGDFQCPSCGAFARSIEPQIRAAYIDTGKARLEWHDFAWIGGESRDAANAARCAGDQGRFWEYHDLLYQNQAGENQGAFSKDRLKSFGGSLGLDAATFDSCVDRGAHAGAVQADVSDVRAKGFNGTPTFLIGDQRIVGAQPFAVFAAAIDAALATQ